MSNLESVQNIYAAFSQGDIPGILRKLSESVEWEYGTAPNDVPWLQPRRGREEVTKFFTSLNGLEFHQFIPKALLEGEGIVVALVDVDLTVRQTGNRITEEDEVHIWHFDDSGQVIRFRHALDSYQHVLACQD